MKSSHDFLFSQIVNESNASFSGENSSRKLTRVVLSDHSTEVSGTTDVALLPGTEQVIHFFRYIELHGKNLDQLDGISLIPTNETSHLSISTKEPTVYRVKVPTLPAPDVNTLPMAIRLRGSATIESIELVSHGRGIDVEFDTLPHVNLGHDQPPVKVDLEVDLASELSIEGHVELDRSKWFRYYGQPNKLSREMERYMLDHNFLPGRQMFKFQPALVEYHKGVLAEDPERPGFADRDRLFAFDSREYANTERDYPGLKFAMCLNDYPEFMAVEHTGRGTPRADQFPAAADLVAAFLKNQIEDSGRTATWWEVKNESTIKAEWDFHYQPNLDAWGLLADFHNQVADKVHAEAPGVAIGGPSSAWMQIQVNDFSLWNDQRRFMDQTKGHLDFYSHHFYENVETIGAFARRGKGYTNYLLGRLETILDMFQAHMSGTDNLRPILITEYGALNVGNSETDYWLRLRSNSAYLTRLMNRPDQIELAVPFVFLASPWDPKSGYATMIPEADSDETAAYAAMFAAAPVADYRLSPNRYLFELWKDFEGKRIPVNVDLPFVETVGVYQGDTIQIAVNNMNGRRISLDLKSAAGLDSSPNVRFKSITQRRLYRLDGKIKLTETELLKEDYHSIPVEVEETMILTVKLESPLQPLKTKLMRTFYASETAIKTASQPDGGFAISVEGPEEVHRAWLSVGFQCSGGITQPIIATFNGTKLELDNSIAKDFSESFITLKVAVPTKLVHAENHVSFSTDQTNLTITSVKLQTERAGGR